MKPRRLENPLRLIGLFLLFGVSRVFAADSITGEELMRVLNVSQDQFSQLEKGEIISCSVAEKSEKELGTGVASFIAAPVALVSAKLREADAPSPIRSRAWAGT
jgi:transcriptional regulator with XRE-family HTH domain